MLIARSKLKSPLTRLLGTGQIVGRGPAAGHPWLDAGNYVRTIEERQGLKIGVPEEVAWRRGFITDDELRERAEFLVKSGYSSYLLDLLDRGA